MESIIAGTLENWRASGLQDAQLRAFFWYGTKVSDPSNFTLATCPIRSDGSFELRLPRVPDEKTATIDTLVPRTPSVTLDPYTARVSNCIELAVLGPDSRYRYMVYQTTVAPGTASLPIGGVYVYYRYVTEKVLIDGYTPITETAIYLPSGELVSATRVTNYRYEESVMNLGWNTWGLRLTRNVAEEERIVMDYDVLSVAPEATLWQYYDRPELD